MNSASTPYIFHFLRHICRSSYLDLVLKEALAILISSEDDSISSRSAVFAITFYKLSRMVSVAFPNL